MVKIRLARGGRKNRPVFTIVAADGRCPRDGKFLQKLGQYVPFNAEDKQILSVKTDDLRTWVNNGAEVSDTVRTLLKRNNVKY